MELLDENGGCWAFEEKEGEGEGWVPPHLLLLL